MQTIGIVCALKSRIADPDLMSQLRTVPSVDPVISILPSASMPRHATGPVCPEKMRRVRPFSNDQDRAVQSVDPLMRMSLNFTAVVVEEDTEIDLEETEFNLGRSSTRFKLNPARLPASLLSSSSSSSYGMYMSGNTLLR